MRVVWAGVVVLACVAFAPAGEPAGKLVQEFWDAAFLNGEKAGYYHTTVTESKRGNQTVLKVARELRLSVKRFGDIAQIRASSGDEETPDGKLLGVFMTLGNATNQQIKLNGTVANGVLTDTIEDPSIPKEKQVRRTFPLPDDLITFLTEDSFL